MKISKLALTLFFCLVASLYAADWTGYVSEPDSKRINGKIFYEITKVEELAWFAKQVNSGKNSINAMLANDVKFMGDTSKTSAINWSPIGKDSSVMFNGTFDGAGRTIYGLYSEQEKFAGIFGVAGENAIIKDLKSVKSSIVSRAYSGGIVSFNWGNVSGCANDGQITSNDNYSGGIAGWNAGTVADCINKASVSGTNGGGIAGQNVGTVMDCVNRGSITGSNAGGIVGKNVGIMIGCMNGGSITVSAFFSGNVRIGGVAGWNEGTMENCINNASVYSGEFFESSGMGGIVGWNEGTVRGCENGGLLSSSSTNIWVGFYIGGIVGRNLGTIMNCRNLGDVLSNYDSLPYSGTRSGGGGLVGFNKSIVLNSFSIADSANAGVVYSDSGSVGNCYYDSDLLTDKSTVAPNLGMHTSDMQSDRFAWMLNTTNGTAEHSGVWSRDSVGYPIFSDSIFKPIYKIFFDDRDVLIFRYSNYKGLVVFPSDPEPPEGKSFLGWYADDGTKVEKTTVFTKDQIVFAVFDSTQIPQSKNSSSSAVSSSSGKSSSSVASSSSSAKSSASSAVKNSSSSSENSDAIVSNLPSPAWSVTAAGRNFLIHAAPVGKAYALFDLQGKVLAKGRIESSEMTFSAPRAGSYIVRIGKHSVRMNAR